MTGALAVKGFNEISYDELMDVNGGGSFYAYGEVNSDGSWRAEVGYETNSGHQFALGVSSSQGPYITYRHSY